MSNECSDIHWKGNNSIYYWHKKKPFDLSLTKSFCVFCFWITLCNPFTGWLQCTTMLMEAVLTCGIISQASLLRPSRLQPHRESLCSLVGSLCYLLGGPGPWDSLAPSIAPHSLLLQGGHVCFDFLPVLNIAFWRYPQRPVDPVDQ